MSDSNESENRQELNNSPSDHLDHLLQILVHQVNLIDGLSIGITLQVDGVTISGALIGGSEYFDTFTEQFTSAFSDEGLRMSYRDLLSDIGSVYKQKPTETSTPIIFIHLKDAKFYNSSAPIVSNGILWRGRISKVSGFSLGQIGPRP